MIKKGLFELPKTVPALAADLIEKLLKVNPEIRLGSHDINDLYSHKFFDGVNFDTIFEQEPPE